MPQSSVSQRRVYRGIGTVYETRGIRWLKRAGFNIVWYSTKKHNHPFDVRAKRNRKDWAIEIKGGEKPAVRIQNLLKMYREPGITRLGLLFMVEDDEPLFFELRKMSRAGFKAARSRGSSKRPSTA